MLPTDGKATLEWPFFNPLGNFFNLKLLVSASVFGLSENPT